MKRSLARDSLTAVIERYMSSTPILNSSDLSEIVLNHAESVIGMLPPNVSGPIDLEESEDDNIIIKLWSWEVEGPEK